MIRAVAFDVDGTMYPNLFMYISSIPFFIFNPKIVYHFGYVRRRIRGIYPIQDFRNLQGEIFSSRTGIALEKSVDIINEKIYKNWIKYFRAVPIFPGLQPFLEKCKKSGIKLAVLSDYPVEEKLKYFNVADFFEIKLCSDKSGYLKPQKEPFMMLSRELGVPPDKILYVGNSYKNDILGALNSGYKTAYIGCGKKNHADITFLCYKELWRFVQKNIQN